MSFEPLSKAPTRSSRSDVAKATIPSKSRHARCTPSAASPKARLRRARRTARSTCSFDTGSCCPCGSRGKG
eukprot:3979283-Prymnesium_polylepis.1